MARYIPESYLRDRSLFTWWRRGGGGGGLQHGKIAVLKLFALSHMSLRVSMGRYLLRGVINILKILSL